MPHIVSIVYTPDGIERRPLDHYARVPLERAILVEGRGIAGDLKGTLAERQLNVMCAETLAELAADGRKTGPGEMGEQLVIAGLVATSLGPGVRLRLGTSAAIEVVKPRTGCARFEQIQGVTKQSVAGRLGVIACVIVGGEIAVGDAVAIMNSTA